MICPKKTSFDGLTQDDVDLMMNHINSYARKALGGQTPIEVFTRQFANIEGLHEKLGIRTIDNKDITLKPSLLK
jgi:hypothetical protein